MKSKCLFENKTIILMNIWKKGARINKWVLQRHRISCHYIIQSSTAFNKLAMKNWKLIFYVPTVATKNMKSVRDKSDKNVQNQYT